MYFESLWNKFAKLEQTQAIALGGSRAGNFFDEKSDYDLYIYCTSIPNETQRKQILDECCKYTEIGNSFWELEDDCTLKNGVDIDILYRNIENFSQTIADVVENHTVYNGYTTCMWHNLLNCKILYDKNGALTALQNKYKIPYPDELKNAIIKKNMQLLTEHLPSYDAQIKKAFERNDFVSINHRTAAFLESYFDIIFALNKLTHPGEKRMMLYAKTNATILPANFEKNLNELFKNIFFDFDKTTKIISTIINELKKVIK